MRPFQGDDGELIGAFTDLLDQEPADDPAWWHLLGFEVAMVLGGSLHRARPDYGVEPAVDSVGFEMSKGVRPLLRGDYVNLIALRMAELVKSGVSEAFLVQSLVDHLANYLRRMSDVPAINERRRAQKERLLAAAIAATNDEDRAGYERTAGRMEDVTAEEEVTGGARRKRWTQGSAALSDDRVEGWVLRRTERLLDSM